MWKSVWILCVLTVLADAGPQGNVLVSREISDMPANSSPVPIWQYWKTDGFVCKTQGYFADQKKCKYFYKCTAYLLGHPLRFVYQCDGDLVYSIEKNDCVRPEESGRVECGGMVDQSEEQSTISDQGSREPNSNETEPQNDDVDLLRNGVDELDGSRIFDKIEKFLLDEENPSTTEQTTEKSTSVDETTVPTTVEENVEIATSEENPTTTEQTTIESTTVDETTVPTTVEENVEIATSEEDSTTTEQTTIESTTVDETTAPSTTVEENIEIVTSTTIIPSETDQFSEEFLESTTGEVTKEEETEMTMATDATSLSMSHETDTTSVEQTTTVSETPTSIEPEYFDEYEDSECIDEGFFGVTDDCSTFYRCVPFGRIFIKYDFKCPRGTIWDDHLKTCNFRAAIRQITCKDKRNLSIATEFPAVESDVTYIVGNLTSNRIAVVCPTGFRQHPKYCNVFYQCTTTDNLEVNFLPLLCPENTVFDEKSIQCTRNETGGRNGCTNFDRTGTPNSIEMLQVSSMKLCPEEGRFPYGDNCTSHYFNCKRDARGSLMGYLFECPPGQVYSPTLKGCMLRPLSPICANHQTELELGRNLRIPLEI